MTAQPVHTSLQREFFAAVPARPVRLRRRILWWLLLRLAALRSVQVLIRKRVRP